jgi:aerotaxis receptor
MKRPEPIDEEYTFSDGIIVSSTDLRGIITYANRKFCEIANYSKKELTGKNHNIIRHPDMPKAAFEEMWDTIKKGKSWNGLVKNLRKDGKYYWVNTYITPIKDSNGETVGYTAARRPANNEEIEEVVPQYKSMLLKEANN